ncbi:MAG: autotransporter-associated beta strand repeat-containing protein [Proteobacteria bacterium]|nr:autotransporter-associated beta strand repeat-containing protein [Pseudomonadota bacterium]
MRATSRNFPIVAAVLASILVGISHRADALDIVPTFDSSITSAANAADIENSINIATAAIGGLYSNPGTVKILFQYQAPTNASFLGESFTQLNTLSYSDYTALLTADSNAHPKNSALATAVANLPNGNDANGSKPIEATTALLRAGLGEASATPCFNAQGNFVASCNSTYDGVIILNANGGLDFTRPIPAYNGSNIQYDAIETEEHEIDEILGGGGQGSTLGGSDQNSAFGPFDLYRYSAPGTRSHTPSPNASSYFSIDGGQTDIVGFSQYNDGSDYSDWGPDISNCPVHGFIGGPGYVQDTDSCSNKQSDVTNASPEFTMLEALGYNPSTAAQMPVIAWNCSTNPDATNYSGSINAIKEASCTQIVTGDSTFTGGTNIDTGTLQLGNGGTTGSVTGNIIDSGTLVFDHSNTVTYGGVISGGGALTQSGTGTLILTGDNTFSGFTFITLGDTLQLGDGGATGSIAGNIGNHGTLIFDRSNTLTYAGTITGQGNVEVTGGGTLIFTGTNSYSGGTTISSGDMLQIGDGGTDGLIQGVVTDNGTLAFDHSDTVTYKAKISGTGELAQIGTGTTILTAANSYTGGTFIGAGTLQVGNGGTTGVIVGDVIDNATLAFDHTDDISFSGAISGSGMLEQEGTGTLTLTGDSTFTGGANIDAGTLQLGDGDTTGSVTSGIIDNGSLVFNHSSPVTYGGVISGSGTLTQSGAGTLILTGDNTFSGLTTVTSGDALQLGNGGATGSVTSTIADDGTLAFYRSNALTYAGMVMGQGNVNVIGGTVIFTGTNSYSGGTTISSGSTLQIGNGGTSGLVQGAITDNGTLVFDHSDAVAVSGQISGTGAFAQIGAGTTILTAANGYTGGTFIGAGTLQAGNGGTTGAIVGDVIDNATLAFDRTDNISFSGAISGSGMVLQKGSGTLTLSGANSYSGGTGVGTGMLEAASSGALGTGLLSLDGAPAALLLDNGVNLANPIFIAQASFIDVNGSDSATLSGSLSGNAPFEKDGTGTLVVSGNNGATYSGNISFHGTLSVAATGALGTGTVTVLGSNLVLADGVTYANPTVLADDLTIEQNGGAATITAPIGTNGGTWGLTKTGVGILTLANANTFTGLTIAANGLLVISGSLAGGLTVNSGASVAITGVIAGGVNVQAGGSLSQPTLGQGFGKATLASYSETGSTLSVNFGGISSGFNSSSLVVPGAVVLQGGLLDPHPVGDTSDYAFDQRYVIIASPNAISGAFSNPSGFIANTYDADLLQRIRYDLGGVVLEVRRLIDFSAIGTTPVQKSAGTAINSTEADASDSWASLLTSLSLLSPAKQENALSQISGESLLDAAHIASDSLDVLDEHLRSHVIDVGGAGGQVAAFGDDSHIWIATLGRDEHTNSYDGYSGYRTQIGELAFGGDTMLSDTITAGVAMSTGRPHQTDGALSTSVSGNLEAYGVYGRFDPGPAYITAALTTDAARLREHRTIAFGSVDDPAAAAFHQHATMGSVELDLRLAAFGGEMEPLLRFSYVVNKQSGLHETDNGTGLGLDVAPYSHDTLTETVGTRWRRVFHDGDTWIAPEATVAAALEGMDDLPATNAVLQGAPANSGVIAITADRAAPASGVLDLGMTAGLNGTPLALRVDYEGRISGRATGQSASLNVSYAW